MPREAAHANLVSPAGARPDVVVIGASARAAAASAILGGLTPWCVDRFADVDLQAMAATARCPSDRWPRGLTSALRQLDPPDRAPILLTGAMENHLPVVRRLMKHRRLLGADPDAIAQVRRPGAANHLGDGVHVVWPATHRHRDRWTSTLHRRIMTAAGRRYLEKPVRSAGGRRISFADPGLPIAPGRYLQQYIAGVCISAVFVADGWSARLLGVTEQLVGWEAFGASGFQFVGNLASSQTAADRFNVDQLDHHLALLGVRLTQRFDLRGVFGVDAVIDRPRLRPWAQARIRPVEVNPRYPAGTEVIDRLTGISTVGAAWDLLAPLEGLPPRPAAHTSSPRKPGQHDLAPTRWCGKAIVHARVQGRAPELPGSLSQDVTLADRPTHGEPIHVGHPICTVLADASDREACLERLVQAAAEVYTRMQP